MWDEITYPFSNFNGATVEIAMDIHRTFYWAYDYLSMLGLQLNYVSEIGTRKQNNTQQVSLLLHPS